MLFVFIVILIVVVRSNISCQKMEEPKPSQQAQMLEMIDKLIKKCDGSRFLKRSSIEGNKEDCCQRMMVIRCLLSNTEEIGQQAPNFIDTRKCNDFMANSVKCGIQFS